MIGVAHNRLRCAAGKMSGEKNRRTNCYRRVPNPSARRATKLPLGRQVRQVNLPRGKYRVKAPPNRHSDRIAGCRCFSRKELRYGLPAQMDVTRSIHQPRLDPCRPFGASARVGARCLCPSMSRR